ncbi:MAG: hypothetical protein OZ923_08370 [Comamonadaceae bacterium]|nr:hypothetical protein [Burkholderiales bacterium]MEB2348615.1 hypothetical protein [Comamonadaceae bacterium]
MKQFSRGISTFGAVAVTVTLVGCASQPRYTSAQQRYSVQQVPVHQNQPDPQGTLHGTVVNIEPVTRSGGTGATGAVVGGGGTLAAIAGVVVGALTGNAIEPQGIRGIAGSSYVTIRFDNGDILTYEVPTLGNVRKGDRVRVYQGQITRM